MRVAVDGVYFGTNVGRLPDDVIKLAAGVGADGLNWPLHPHYHADPARFAKKIADFGLAVVSLGLMPHISAVPGSEFDFRELVKRALDAAHIFGAPVLDLWTWHPPDVDKAAAQTTLAHNIEAVAPMVADAGCVLSFEFEPDTTLERYDEALTFLAPFGPTVRITADTYHIFRVGDDLLAAAMALGPRIGIIHFSGSHRGEPCSEGSGGPEGSPDHCEYEPFLRAAVKAGYAGDVVLQYKPPVDAEGRPDEEETAASLKRAVAFARTTIASL
jgi:sugar phosphate isomerase/epimerase